MRDRDDEIAKLKVQRTEYESQMLQDKEAIAQMKRELEIQKRQLTDAALRAAKSTDELDMYRFKLQETHRENTELKLKVDVANSTISGLDSEKSHLNLELKELRDLTAMYEGKTKQLMLDLQETTA